MLDYKDCLIFIRSIFYYFLGSNNYKFQAIVYLEFWLTLSLKMFKMFRYSKLFNYFKFDLLNFQKKYSIFQKNSNLIKNFHYLQNNIKFNIIIRAFY